MKSREQAEAELGPYVNDFAKCVRDALEDFLQRYAEERHRLSLRSQASIISDLMRDRFEARFRDEPGVTIYKKRNCFMVDFHGRWIIKLKKFKPGHGTSNIATQAVLDFLDHQTALQPDLPGWPPEPTSLHLGYLKQGIELAQSEVALACPSGSGTAWAWALVATPVPSQATVEPFKVAEPAIPRPKRIRRRADVQASNDDVAGDSNGRGTD